MTQKVSTDAAQQRAAQQGTRKPWTTPQVIVSDLGNARGASVTTGADGSVSTYGTYGS